ncbi:thiamine pyrophosphate-dependent enzyme [Arthrobacter rhombi]|uniref:Acetolactate synthase large subunit n=1 Tax=Arthrobacter rhombi TaxID=71253 RepID=A0A1R4FQX2_9MICC|nr:thiamine pyrophosphate-dependent enzyme [Arthrobacter rhombi]SJM58354.1 Acetolactate synthase large subunit [Arthrobacter rhombi]
MSTSAGHLIVRQLEAHGVRRVYSVPGESFLDVLDGLHDSPITTVVARQEGGAGFMALAESRLTSIPGITLVTRGPGAANAMIAVHTAWQDATALVLFVGLIPVADRGRDSFQEFSLDGWFGTTAKRVIVLDDEHRAADVVSEAMHAAASGRPGPVVVGLPEDVLVRMTDAQPVSPRPVPAPVPDAASNQELGARLGAAQRPLIIAGGDGWALPAPEKVGTAGAALAAWAEQAHVPIAADWRAYDTVPHDSAAWAGYLGYYRSDALAEALGQADLLVFIGCARTDVLSDGYTRGLEAETVLVLPEPEATGHAGRIDQQLMATPASFTSALPHVEGARGSRGSEWMDRLTAEQRGFATPQPEDPATGVDLSVAFGLLEAKLPADRILTYGAGNATLWGHRYLKHSGPGTLVAPRNGAMGVSIPAAVAATLVHPERVSVAICGDGDFMMNGQELAVAMAHGAAPLVVVVDNGVFATIVQHQERHYPGRPSGTAMTNPDFAAFIATFGGHGEDVSDTAEAGAAIDRALEAVTVRKVPALLHLRIDPATMPPSTALPAFGAGAEA